MSSMNDPPHRQPWRDRAAHHAHRQALGIRTVAIHTANDRDALHVRAADDAVEVPSYLDIDAIVAAAVEVGADAIHPGYGFLSERSAFARAIEGTDGLVLVGPSADVMDKMGKKDAAREIAIAAGVPVVPSYSVDADPSTYAYPVLVKAAAGGGGKGMRIVRSRGRVRRSAGRREARGAHGVRRRHDPDREVRRARPSHRGAGLRRRPRQRRAPLRARLLDAAPAPEGAGGGAGARRSPTASASSSRAARSTSRARSATPTPARSSSCSTATPARSTSSR